MVSLQERLVPAGELFPRSERGLDGRDYWSVLFGNSLQPIAVDPLLTKDQGDWDGQEGELDARVLAPFYSSADGCFRRREGVVLAPFA